MHSAYSRHCTLKSIVYIYTRLTAAYRNIGTYAVTNVFTCKQAILGSYSDLANRTSKYSDLVPGRKCLPGHSIQWRFSFSVAEVILLQSWTQTQQIVYHFLRFFAKRELIQKDCPKEDEVLCTYHLKTLMSKICPRNGGIPHL